MGRTALKKLALFLLAALIMLAAAGCSDMPAANGRARDGFKIFRYRGKELALPERPQRVVLLSSALTELWAGAGGADKLAGCPLSGELDGKIKSSLKKETIDIGVGAALNVEKILEIQPDLVVGLEDKALHGKIKTVMAANKIPYLEVKNLLFQDNCEILRLFGQLLHEEERTEALISGMRQKIASARRLQQGRAPVKVLMLWGSVSNVMMITPNSRQGELLAMAKGVNIVPPSAKEHGYLPVSLEFIVERQPDVILLQGHGDKEKMQKCLKQDVLDNPAWNSLQAVRQGRVYFLPPEIFTVNPGLKTPEAVVYLSKIIY